MKFKRTRTPATKVMDAWGYNFVLGSAQAWFERDAEDGRDWLLRHGLIDADETPLLRRREG